MNILIVEDNEDNRSLVIKRLKAAGHTLAEARSGAEALEALRGAPYDVVLLDLQLPDMDGLQLARLVRADSSLERIVLIACTAFAMAGDRETALAAGCDGYVSKPVDIRMLPNQLLEIYHATGR